MSRVPYNVGVGVAAFVFYNGKALFQQRKGAHGANTWAPPGGKLDYGETPEQGVTREVFEETGLKIHSLRFIGFTNDIFESDGLHYITLWYVAQVSSDNARITEPHKCIDQKWLTLSEAPSNLFIPTMNILKDEVALKILEGYKK